jgi:pyroglutamyl-peptidase
MSPDTRHSILSRRFLQALLICLASWRTTPVDAQDAAPAEDGRPVILLTGFEPFGPGRPPNSSWEGVRGLDGREWRGYRLVSKQLPCVWGEPLKHLEPLVTELKPAAIFSFGMGGADSFAIETRASNQRGSHPDNNDAQPSQPLIVADGPRERRSTADAQALKGALLGKGQVVRVSTNAGRYLCEECLYTIEHLKATHPEVRMVMFTHVPPLGTRLQGDRVDAAYVQKYILDLLESWHELTSPPAQPPVVVAAAPQPADPALPAATPPVADARARAVEQAIRRYFSTWSAQDMAGYGACFVKDATIHHIDDAGEVTKFDLAPFLTWQRNVTRRADPPMTETPETIDVRFEQGLARAVVHWKLSAGARVEYGYDHFTLAQQNGEWKIVNLVFYGAESR